jgi:protoheme IX farnesyltransferase
MTSSRDDSSERLRAASAGRFRRLAVVTAVSTLALTGVGGLVRATGSGLGCLDEWPKCRGGWIAPLDYTAVIEYSHRALAGVVVLLLVALVVAARRWMRTESTFFTLSVAGLVVVLGQALLGRQVVTSGLHAALVTAHLIAALALVTLTTTIAALCFTIGRPRADGSQAKIVRLAYVALGSLLPLFVVGAFVREKGAGLAFDDWPLMNGTLLPSFDTPGAGLHFAHRVLALLVAGHLIGLAIRARRDERPAVRFYALGGVAAFFAQALVGAANVWTKLAPAAVVGHATLAFVTWAAFVASAIVARAGQRTHAGSEDRPPRAPGVSDRVMAYVMLTKPRIITLLLITTVPAMVLAAHGLPSLWLIVATLIGGMLTAGSANAFNQYLERDIDEQMQRTKSRPLPSHAVGATPALVFAIAIGIIGFVWLWSVVNLLSAILAASAIAFYVIVYTVLLKRNTPQNIVIGGAAGAAPVLIGWAAVTNTIGAPAWVMFAIVFLWTPPHFWALAMRYRDDYAAAGVPMLPVVRGDRSTTFQILVYSVVLVASTLVLQVVGGLGLVYAVAAVALGVGFLYRAARLRSEPTGQMAFGLFKYSITYLALLFAAIAVDRLMW